MKIIKFISAFTLFK